MNKQKWFGYVIFNERGLYEHTSGLFYKEDSAHNALIEFLKNHIKWRGHVFEYKLGPSVSLTFTPKYTKV